MKPLDPRLLRTARAARSVLAIGAVLGVVRTLAVVAWCWFLAQAITAVALPALGIPGGAASAAGGRVAEGSSSVADLPSLLLAAGAALVVRTGAGFAMDRLAARGAVLAKSQLRTAALDALDARSPLATDGRSEAERAVSLGRGLDALDGYFSGYLPQLILAACATPILVLTVLLADPVSGITVLIVFPVIPIFMILIGLATQRVQDRQWSQLNRLSRSFLDAVEGLPTLKIFRRESRQSERIARETGDYRSRTMQVLRVTFLSGFVLDLAGTFSIALVAVTVGTRLVSGSFPLGLGLFVLLLLPETFAPIRQVGAAYHASAEGLAAVGAVFALIDGPSDPGPRGDETAGSKGASGAPSTVRAELGHGLRGIRFDGVVVHRGDRAVVGPVSFEVVPGEVVALAGPSGAGKTSLVATLLGFLEPSTGSAAHSGAIAWSGQRPDLLQGTVAENLALGADRIDDERAERVLERVGLGDLDARTPLGAGGSGLSGGQAQRVAVARALYRADEAGAHALVLDEPSSALDAQNETVLADALRAEAEAGRAVLVISHRAALLASADRVVRIGDTE
ncbi:thiol reductant ABC exporter subunit CydD [Leucobacter sp. OLJS4]|uniref:thiol reductant ABC exporter subunit CydD n=1 Tax=unclassified Leucobacter TaxID=2621730 RepID=UPI000C18014D|nr:MULTISPECIES: thiol reductant ABC exporter subunit CydD [unclassified Leucobacter]PIJ29487.1 thiol reductant ABC exporter subunit CydD [Leucobacter sp. OLES1]PII81658.1 thiol reductant ABC exporter subunit CydD [Leucobacter sp. OLCALW19]PII86330.1 thiol reductant ABC exporter subunit CydD [Leucobacter sp. OLTLW20]PII90225.1 thiol reductant ABC exporter subunit CydD [Leucobacter sp. OLAS13]PII97258.1 thiol reductant ABC exporter subunit CydD [Leucobacter sp. OLDS2]